jgi:phospholipid/cholesterol/gamma-HCH transport system substrate-binding protein
MNERIMQFRIGMFVIVAGLVLTMLIVWFGESPQILREQGYIKVHYAEAPGVLQGVAVRKSGIRVGEVVAIDFDDRPNQPDGVLVTLALERKFKIRQGSVPRLTRSLIGDVTIDLLPGEGEGQLQTADTPDQAEVIEGEVAADPSKALAAATKAFERAGSTLDTIQEAAGGLAKLSQSAQKLDDFLVTWDTTGKNVSGAAKGISGFIDNNEADFKAAVANLQKVAEKLNTTLDPATQDALKTGVARFSAASARLDSAIADAEPLLKDLGAPVSRVPTTDFGQSVRRINRIASDLELLTASLRTRKGTLNTDGSIQKLLTRGELYDNFNTVAVSANQTLNQFKLVLASFRSFAEKVSSDPGAISRGILNR